MTYKYWSVCPIIMIVLHKTEIIIIFNALYLEKLYINYHQTFTVPVFANRHHYQVTQKKFVIHA